MNQAPDWSTKSEPRPKSRPKSDSALVDQPIYENLKSPKPNAPVFVFAYLLLIRGGEKFQELLLEDLGLNPSLPISSADKCLPKG